MEMAVVVVAGAGRLPVWARGALDSGEEAVSAAQLKTSRVACEEEGQVVTGVCWDGVLLSEKVCRTESRNMTEEWDVGLRVGLVSRSSSGEQGGGFEGGREQG